MKTEFSKFRFKPNWKKSDRSKILLPTDSPLYYQSLALAKVDNILYYYIDWFVWSLSLPSLHGHQSHIWRICDILETNILCFVKVFDWWKLPLLSLLFDLEADCCSLCDILFQHELCCSQITDVCNNFCTVTCFFWTLVTRNILRTLYWPSNRHPHIQTWNLLSTLDYALK